MTRINHPHAHHIHDCERCILLGSVFIDYMHEYDVYECPGHSAVVRYGEEGEYWSQPLSVATNLELYPKGTAERALWLAVKGLTRE